MIKILIGILIVIIVGVILLPHVIKAILIKKMGGARFEVKGDQALMEGVISHRTIKVVEKLIQENPRVRTIVMKNVPGSLDDEANLKLSRLIRDKGINTHVPSDGRIASGGTDFFCAGLKRTAEEGARIGIHSWASFNKEGKDYPKDHKEHEKYLDYYNEMGIPEEFYWFTLDVAPAKGMHDMNREEMEKYSIITE